MANEEDKPEYVWSEENPRPATVTEEEMRISDLTAMMIGYNEMAKRAKSLGERLFSRLVRDKIAEELGKLGCPVEMKNDSETVVTLRSRPPHIFLYAKDIELMRQAVAEFDAKKAAGT